MRWMWYHPWWSDTFHLCNWYRHKRNRIYLDYFYQNRIEWVWGETWGIRRKLCTVAEIGGVCQSLYVTSPEWLVPFIWEQQYRSCTLTWSEMCTEYNLHNSLLNMGTASLPQVKPVRWLNFNCYCCYITFWSYAVYGSYGIWKWVSPRMMKQYHCCLFKLWVVGSGLNLTTEEEESRPQGQITKQSCRCY